MADGELYFEDLKAGDRFAHGSVSVSEAEIVAFARQYDPQPFHMDARAGEASVFKGLAASGWHTAALTMRLYVTGSFKLAKGSVGLGIEALNWPEPVHPGDTLTASTEVLEVRPSRTKPDRGIARIHTLTTNQKGQVVQTQVAKVLVWKRPAAPEKP